MYKVNSRVLDKDSPAALDRHGTHQGGDTMVETDISRTKGLRRGRYGAVVALTALSVTVGVSGQEPAAPTVARNTVYLDTVERGPMVRNVRGTGTLVRIGGPTGFKAELRIAETQSMDLELGLSVSIDTRNGIIPGHISQIADAVQEGTVTVDVALDGELPRGVRQNLTVDGTIELERLDNITFVGRPVFGRAQSTISLFRLDPESDHAVRTRVRLGRTSVNMIEVLEGLQPGDTVILSDMSAWDAFDRVRLN